LADAAKEIGASSHGPSTAPSMVVLLQVTVHHAQTSSLQGQIFR
jgi:hypothetical protein